MQSVRDSIHALRKLRLINNEVAIITASSRPAVVENDVIIAKVSKAVIDQQLRGFQQKILGHVAGEGVPIVLSSIMPVKVLICSYWDYLPIPSVVFLLDHCSLLQRELPRLREEPGSGVPS